MLPEIAHARRVWLEGAARRRALLVERVYDLYPEVVDQGGMTATLVEAELRQSTPTQRRGK